MRIFSTLFIFILILNLTACGFRPQSEKNLAPPLLQLYVQTADPYGFFTKNLKLQLKTSKVNLVDDPKDAQVILHILKDETSQELLSTSGSQQTRQYNLHVTIHFDLSKKNGEIILPLQILTETRTITVLANQILGSNNEAMAYYKQMRESLARAVMNRIASKEVTKQVQAAFAIKPSL